MLHIIEQKNKSRRNEFLFKAYADRYFLIKEVLQFLELFF